MLPGNLVLYMRYIQQGTTHILVSW